MLAWFVGSSYLFKNKRRMARFCLLVAMPCVAFLGLAHVAITEVFVAGGTPDLIVMGGAAEPKSARVYPTLDAARQNILIARHQSDIEDVIPFSYYNLQDVWLYKTFTHIQLSVLIVPDRLLSDHVARYIRTGPGIGQDGQGCVVGSIVARQFDLRPGDALNVDFGRKFSFKKREANQTQGQPPLPIVATMSDEIVFPFFRGAVLVPESVIERIGGTIPKPNGLMLYLRGGATGMDADLATASLTTLHRRTTWYRSGMVSFALVGLLVWCCTNLLLIASAFVTDNQKDIGILKSMGVRQATLHGAFAITSVALVLVGGGIAAALTLAVIRVINHMIRTTSPYAFLTDYHTLHGRPFVLLGCSLLLGSIASVIRLYGMVRAASPDQLIRRV